MAEALRITGCKDKINEDVLFVGRILVCFYSPMHEVTPKVVAMAVSTVIRTCKILLQMFLFSLFMVG